MKNTRFKPGQSGNPNGRPPNAGPLGELRKAIGKDLPVIVAKLSEQAKSGDIAASRLLLERVFPPIKAVEHAEPVALGDGSLTDQGKEVLAAVAAGELAPAQAAQLLGGLGSLAKLIETDELERRIAALEERHGNKPE